MTIYQLPRMASYKELPPRTPADGCESTEHNKTTEYSAEDSVLCNQFSNVNRSFTLLDDSQCLKQHLSTNMKKFSKKRESMKRREYSIYERHRRSKKMLHDFLNNTIQEQHKVTSTIKKRKPSMRRRLLTKQYLSPSKLLTILKNGKKCTFC